MLNKNLHFQNHYHRKISVPKTFRDLKLCIKKHKKQAIYRQKAIQ